MSMDDPRLNAEAVARLEQREAIVRKGMRLQIATELLAGMFAQGVIGTSVRPDARAIALTEADALIRENEAML